MSGQVGTVLRQRVRGAASVLLVVVLCGAVDGFYQGAGGGKAAWFLPMAGATLLATLFRCMEKASYPLYASIGAAVANTALNYLLIFGRLGFAPMGAEGAAIATVISQGLNLLIMLALFLRHRASLSPAGGESPKNPFH